MFLNESFSGSEGQLQGGGTNMSSGSKQNIAEIPMTDRYEPLGGSDGLMDSAIAQPLADGGYVPQLACEHGHVVFV